MLILIIIGLLGLIFSICIILSLILYFTSKDVIGDHKEYDKLEDVGMLDKIDVSSSDKETQKERVTQMNEHRFIEIHGIDKAERIVENVVYNATHYSDTTGSYYSTQKNDSVSIKALKKAIKDFKEVETLKQKYESKLKDWKKKSVKGLNT